LGIPSADETFFFHHLRHKVSRWNFCFHHLFHRHDFL
jgi:hypothetical protein